MLFKLRFSSVTVSFFFLTILLIVSQLTLAQQFILKGRVVDSETNSPLAFVNILADDGPDGACTDIDGKFTLHSSQLVRVLKLTYVGYRGKQVNIDSLSSDRVIRLLKTEMQLQEVVIRPGINPANRIIRQVLENRNLNDHEKMELFSYTSYEKTIFGPENDSLTVIDSLAADTSYMELREFFERQHLFIMESVVERRFLYPDKNYNNVIASRVSGMSDPLFVFLMGQLQSTSFYKEIIKIADKDYINPISNGTFTKYYFEIQDTLIEPHPYDTTFIISFRQLLNTNFDGLKGVISISTNNFAIRNIIAQPARSQGMFTIKIQQLYDFVQDEHWFPLQLNTDLIFKGAIGKSSITVGVGPGIEDSSRPDLVGRGKSYISNIRLNPELKPNRFGFVEVDVQPDAYRQKEEVWNQYRIDKLTPRDTMTYHVIDSLGKKEGLDNIGRKFDALANGVLSAGPVDFEIDRFLKGNSHEGIRLGVGLHTNDMFSKYFNLGGYGAYGFDDRKLKYGGNISLNINRFREMVIKFSLKDDVAEPGIQNAFSTQQGLLKPETYRTIYVIQMDHLIKQEASFTGRIFNYLKYTASFARSYREPLYNYGYMVASAENIAISRDVFTFAEASLAIRYAYGEKFIKNAHSLISMGTSYPEIWFNYSRGLNIADGEYTYNRFDLKISKTFSTKYLGKTTIVLNGGLLDRAQPYVNLYNSLGSYRPFGIWSPNSFATMRIPEFSADRFAAIFLSHNFGKLLLRSKHINPEPVLVTNLGFGSLRNGSQHKNIGLKDFRDGYYESGLVINKLLNLGVAGLGIGAFYRYGPYSLASFKENLALKIAVSFAF
jgi:hypothetical protein